MEDPWDNWFSDLDMNIDGTFDQCQANTFVNIEEQQAVLSSKSVAETQSQHPWPKQDSNYCEQLVHSLSSSKRTLNFEARGSQGTKRGRSASEAQEHIMSERKRRQEMAERFIALAAIIPGLKKIDKASVLREAVSYVKQLQERITVLEQESEKENTKSMICIKKSHPCSKSCETISNDHHRSSQVLPDVEAIGLELEKEVLLKIHCEKRKGIWLKLLDLLENIHLSITSSSVLPFGKNTLHITIIAQMGEQYSMTVIELLKYLRRELLKLYDI